MHGVFSSVASRYDLMNDAMSLGIHRLWKDAMLDWLAPRPGMRLLDVAGGTGDIAFRFLRRVKGDGHATVLDMTEDMLTEGRRRAEATTFADRLDWVVGDAMALPFPDASFDAYTISFGIRNVTRIEDALAEAFRVLRPGGRLLVLEFSRVPERVAALALRPLFVQRHPADGPGAGRGPGVSYQYLVEFDPPLPGPGDLRGDDPRGRVRARSATATSRWASRRCTRAGSSEGMRGPHNIWRLIRTGATFERTGAMSVALAAFDAPPSLRVAARVLGWPFQWLGLEGDPSQPPILRALTALGPAYIKFGQLLSTRPGRGRAGARGRADRAPGRAAALPDRGGARDGRARARPAGRRGLLRRSSRRWRRRRWRRCIGRRCARPGRWWR